MESARPPHGDACSEQRLLQFADRMSAEVEDGCGERGVGPAFLENIDEMLRRAGAAGGNYRNGERAGDGRGELAVKTGLRAVAIHGGEQNLSRAALLGLPGPGESSLSRGPASSGYKNLSFGC